jgi:hypothetical protein
LSISDVTILNAFSFGLKMGYLLRNVRVSRLNIDGAGLSGIVLYGPVRDVRISHAMIRDIGVVRGGRGRYSPWPKGNRAGIRLDEGATGDAAATDTPENVLLDDIDVSGPPNSYEFGILNTGGRRIHTEQFRARGFATALSHGIDQVR